MNSAQAEVLSVISATHSGLLAASHLVIIVDGACVNLCTYGCYNATHDAMRKYLLVCQPRVCSGYGSGLLQHRSRSKIPNPQNIIKCTSTSTSTSTVLQSRTSTSTCFEYITNAFVLRCASRAACSVRLSVAIRGLPQDVAVPSRCCRRDSPKNVNI